MAKRPLILVTNDDGITAPGIRMLIKVMNTIGDVVVVAPDSPQSGMGHAITINSTLYVEKVTIDDGPQVEYSCSGTPADCVKIAVREVLDRKPDLCVSGINHGSNASINVIYSGTMSAAIEAGIESIPAIGFSLLDYSWGANFEHSESFVKKIAENVLSNGIPNDVILNVNIPNVKKAHIKGIKICRQARANWEETFALFSLFFVDDAFCFLIVPLWRSITLSIASSISVLFSFTSSSSDCIVITKSSLSSGAMPFEKNMSGHEGVP